MDQFTRLKAILQTTDGNLGAHISTLEGAGYIGVRKDFIGKRPRTRIAMTRSSQSRHATHRILRSILDAAASHNDDKEVAS